MGTVIRPELSKDNPYYISKHRYYELKHFCLQYSEWKDTYLTIDMYERNEKTEDYIDPTSNLAIVRAECIKNMDLINQSIQETDKYLAKYIFKAVTEGASYTYLRNYLNMPCGKDMFYDRYHRFFWILDKSR